MRQYLSFSLAVFLFLPYLVGAATSDFSIKTTIVSDLTPPTTPTLLSATPIASTQIDVSWATSTDDYLLGGYVLLRDGVPRATTTLTNFSDTGLLASTTYSYEVYAFDWTYNISTTSNAIATTTLEAPVVATTTPSVEEVSGVNSNLTLLLRSSSIVTEINSATLFWQTNVPSRYTLRWGRTDSYDSGYVVNESYQSTHQTSITNLEPGTVYLYELVGTSPSGISIVLKKGQFKTKEAVSTNLVQNVSRLEAVAVGDDVRLSWQIPAGDNIAKIRIVRNYLGYPIDGYDGAIVYEGLGSSFVDKGSLSVNSPQYYTVFVIGLDGTISSGAVVVVSKKGVDVSGEGNGTTISPGSVATGTGTGGGIVPTPDLPLFGLDTNNILITQAGQVLTFLSERISLSYREPFTISIPYESLPKHLKSIIVTLLDPTDQRKSYSFLLRINKVGDAYEATVAPLNVLGSSRLQVEIFDFERMLVGKYQKQLDFVTKNKDEAVVVFPDALLSPWRGLDTRKIFWVIGLLSLGMFFLWKRSREDEDKN